jgi:hypothetical protein
LEAILHVSAQPSNNANSSAAIGALTSQGHPHAQFRHAIERRNVAGAWAAAASLGRLSLSDSLALTLLVLEREPAKFPRVAPRWHARYCDERRVSIENALIVLSLLMGLTGSDALPPARALRELLADERDLANEIRH